MHTCPLNKPPPVLLATVATSRVMHKLKESEIPKIIWKTWKGCPKLQTTSIYQGARQDQLFDANYDHVDDNGTCDHCDAVKLIHRLPRGNPAITAIHYGLIASANQITWCY